MKRNRIAAIVIAGLHLAISGRVYFDCMGNARNGAPYPLFFIVLSPLVIIVFLGAMLGKLIGMIGSLIKDIGVFITEFFRLAVHPFAGLVLVPLNSLVWGLFIVWLARTFWYRKQEETEQDNPGD